MKCMFCNGTGEVESIKEEYPSGGMWKKYHSCCDWIYRNLETKQEIQFCGLNPNRDEEMKKFEENKTIISGF